MDDQNGENITMSTTSISGEKFGSKTYKIVPIILVIVFTLAVSIGFCVNRKNNKLATQLNTKNTYKNIIYGFQITLPDENWTQPDNDDLDPHLYANQECSTSEHVNCSGVEMWGDYKFSTSGLTLDENIKQWMDSFKEYNPKVVKDLNPDAVIIKSSPGEGVEGWHLMYTIFFTKDKKSFGLYTNNEVEADKIVASMKLLDDKEVITLDPGDIKFPPFIEVGGGIVKNDKEVYYYGDIGKYIPIKGADAKTFEYVATCSQVEMSSSSYFKDKNRIYVDNFPQENIDVSSFKYIDKQSYGAGSTYTVTGYAKDNKNVYLYCGDKIDRADVSTFTMMKDRYSKDKNNIYYSTDIIKDADVNTFKRLSGEDSKYYGDKNHIFYGGRIINVDRDSFEVLLYGYAKDKNNVYSGGQISFEEMNYEDYNNGKIPKKISPVTCTIQSIRESYASMIKMCGPNQVVEE